MAQPGEYRRPAETRPEPKGRVLFLTYDGLEDHIAQSQILPYVEGLAARGWAMTVVSHEKSRVPNEQLRVRLRSAQIRWVRNHYHRGSIVTTLPRHLAASVGGAGLEATREGRFDLIHARSYLPMMAGVAIARGTRTPLLFDMRGFWPDEKVDAGAWSRGPTYRFGKRVERALFRQATEVVSLTRVGKRELERWPEIARCETPITVIPTCVDLGRFQHALARSPARELRVGYVGSLGERYPVRAMARLIARIGATRPVRWIVLTPNDGGSVLEACVHAGVPAANVEIRAVSFADVPTHLAAMDATVSFVKPSFATVATCPTKFAESLAVGAPVVVNEGIGDCADLVRAHRVGTVTDLSDGSVDRAADELLVLLNDPGLSQRCAEVARDNFSLELALERYEGVYTRMTRASVGRGKIRSKQYA